MADDVKESQWFAWFECMHAVVAARSNGAPFPINPYPAPPSIQQRIEGLRDVPQR